MIVQKTTVTQACGDDRATHRDKRHGGSSFGTTSTTNAANLDCWLLLLLREEEEKNRRRAAAAAATLRILACCSAPILLRLAATTSEGASLLQVSLLYKKLIQDEIEIEQRGRQPSQSEVARPSYKEQNQSASSTRISTVRRECKDPKDMVAVVRARALLHFCRTSNQ